MNDKFKKKPIFIGGLERSGKTAFLSALIDVAKSCDQDIAAFKPFDTGLIKRNADDVMGDGERYCQKMIGEPSEGLISPYIAHENYPIEMAFRRDGININEIFLQDRIKILYDHYQDVFIELPPGMLAPINEKKMVYEWMLSISNRIIWVINPILGQLEHNLAEINLLKSLNCKFHLVLNNATKITDQDLLFYHWEKIESFAQQQIEGMIPFVDDLSLNNEIMKQKSIENIPSLRENLFGLMPVEES